MTLNHNEASRCKVTLANKYTAHKYSASLPNGFKLFTSPLDRRLRSILGNSFTTCDLAIEIDIVVCPIVLVTSSAPVKSLFEGLHINLNSVTYL
jgi:hypothetical protein